MIHKKCGKELDAVSVWERAQVAQYLKDKEGWCSTNFPEEPEDIEEEFICGNCGEPLDEDEVEAFLKELDGEEEDEEDVKP
jgi:hypothetical protein